MAERYKVSNDLGEEIKAMGLGMCFCSAWNHNDSLLQDYDHWYKIHMVPLSDNIPSVSVDSGVLEHQPKRHPANTEALAPGVALSELCVDANLSGCCSNVSLLREQPQSKY